MSIKNNTTSLQSLLETVNALPEASTGVELPTLTNEGAASDLLAGKQLIDQNGNIIEGTMADNSNTDPILLDLTHTIHNIPEGYHDGNGSVTIRTQSKTTAPIKESQRIQPDTGYVLSEVYIDPIPEDYIITEDATATADEIMIGETAYVNGSKITGIFSINEELTIQDDLIEQIQIALQNKTSNGLDPSLLAEIISDQENIISTQESYISNSNNMRKEK